MTEIIPSWAEEYQNNQAIRNLIALIKIVPIIGGGIGFFDEAFLARISNYVEEREKIFFDELALSHMITEDLLDSNSFIHRFSCTYRAVIRTYRREKIRNFANLLINSISQDKIDTFEEYLTILEDLSDREQIILKSLRRYEINYYKDALTRYESDLSEKEYKGDYRLYGAQIKATEDYWNDFLLQLQIEHSIDENIVPTILQRLLRTGLYHTFGRSFWGAATPKNQMLGQTSPLYHDFIKWIESENKNID